MPKPPLPSRICSAEIASEGPSYPVLVVHHLWSSRTIVRVTIECLLLYRDILIGLPRSALLSLPIDVP